MKSTKIFAICLASLLAVSMTACGNEDSSKIKDKATETTVSTEETTLKKDDESSADDSSKSENDGSQDQDDDDNNGDGSSANSISFKTGLWEGTDCLYYFNGDDSGRLVQYDNGTGISFTYEMDEDGSAVFHMGSSTDNTSAEVSFADEGEYAAILWENDNETRMAYIEGYSEDDVANCHGNEELTELVESYYTDNKGTAPDYVETPENSGLYAAFDVYVDGSVAAQYLINRITLIGTNVDTDEDIILK